MDYMQTTLPPSWYNFCNIEPPWSLIFRVAHVNVFSFSHSLYAWLYYALMKAVSVLIVLQLCERAVMRFVSTSIAHIVEGVNYILYSSRSALLYFNSLLVEIIYWLNFCAFSLRPNGEKIIGIKKNRLWTMSGDDTVRVLLSGAGHGVSWSRATTRLRVDVHQWRHDTIGPIYIDGRTSTNHADASIRNGPRQSLKNKVSKREICK